MDGAGVLYHSSWLATNLASQRGAGSLRLVLDSVLITDFNNSMWYALGSQSKASVLQYWTADASGSLGVEDQLEAAPQDIPVYPSARLLATLEHLDSLKTASM